MTMTANRITGRPTGRKAPGGDGADFSPLPRREGGVEEFRALEGRLRAEAEALGIALDVRQLVPSSPDLIRVRFLDAASGAELATYSPATGALAAPGKGPISLDASPAEALALAAARKDRAEDLHKAEARLRAQAAAAGVDLGEGEGPARPPSTNGTCGGPDGAERGDGRRPDGRFAKGNRGGPGNPLGRQVAQLRAALLAAVTDEDVRQIARRLVTAAKAGSVRAAELVLSYCCGRPAPANAEEC